jgi:hypothetical protein
MCSLSDIEIGKDVWQQSSAPYYTALGGWVCVMLKNFKFFFCTDMNFALNFLNMNEIKIVKTIKMHKM